MEKILLDRNRTKRQLLIDSHSYSEKEIVNFTKAFTSNFYEIHLIQTGKIILHLDDSKIHLHENMIVFISPEYIRYWELQGKMTGKILIFEKDFLDLFLNDTYIIYRFNFFNVNSKPFIEFNNSEINYFASFFNEIEHEIKENTVNSVHILRASLHYFLIKINKKYAEYYSLSGNFLILNTIILDFLKLIDKNFTKKHTVSEYANELKISKTHLNTVLKKELKTTASVFIKNRLIQEAKKSLLFSHQNINETACYLGFSEPSNFVRFFKKQTGNTPNEFINNFSK